MELVIDPTDRLMELDRMMRKQQGMRLVEALYDLRSGECVARFEPCAR